MAFVETAGKRETDEKFGRLWFTSLTRFHRVKDPLLGTSTKSMSLNF